MKAENINPFLLSVHEVFETMLDCPVETGQVGAPGKKQGPTGIIGLIGLSGDGKGIVAIKMPPTTALALVGKMIGEKLRSVDASVVDGIGEVVNIIAGVAKAKFTNLSLSLSLPTVVRGDICKLSSQFDESWVEIPFSSKLGDFSLAVGFCVATENEKEKKHASTCSR